MNQLRIAAIVEGDGEVTAVPCLIRRFGDLAGWHGRVYVDPIIRQPASKLIKEGELERHVELAARKLGTPGGILVMLDCEDSCPAELGPQLMQRVSKCRPDFPTSVVLAHREYESWFLASAPSLAGKRGLSSNLSTPTNFELIRGCKEWLSKQMPPGIRYRETEDQAALTSIFDMDIAKSKSNSFEKCYREISSLLSKVSIVTPEFQP